MAITAYLAHRCEVMRRGLRAILGEDHRFSVVGEGGDGLEVCETVGHLRPDVLMVELALRNLGGIEVMRRVKKISPSTRVVVLAGSPDESHVLAALHYGASAFLTETENAAGVLRAAREAAAGRHFLGSPFSEQPIESYLKRARETRSDPYERLTEREREVFHLAAAGLMSSEIASRLGISRRTAEGHRSHIKQKLQIRGQTDLVRRALLRGALSFERSDPVEGAGH